MSTRIRLENLGPRDIIIVPVYGNKPAHDETKRIKQGQYFETDVLYSLVLGKCFGVYEAP